MAYRWQKLIFYGSGGWKAESGCWWEPSSVLSTSVCFHGRRSKRALWDLFYEALTPFMRMAPSCPNHFPRAPPPNTITLGVRVSTYELMNLRGTHSVHCTALTDLQKQLRGPGLVLIPLGPSVLTRKQSSGSVYLVGFLWKSNDLIHKVSNRMPDTQF